MEVIAIQLPARENRYSEAPVLTAEALLGELIPHLKPYLDRPYFIYGHSMGAALGYLAVRHLAASHVALPLRLFASACPAPTFKTIGHWQKGLKEGSSDEHLIASIRTLGGTPQAILNERDYIDAFLSTMRADMHLLASFPVTAERAVNTPITVMLGDSDDEVVATGAEAWPLMTTAHCDLHTFSGGHFYMQTDADAAFALINATVLKDLANISASSGG